VVIIQMMTLTRASQSRASIAHAIFINISPGGTENVFLLAVLRRAWWRTIGSRNGGTTRWPSQPSSRGEKASNDPMAA